MCSCDNNNNDDKCECGHNHPEITKQTSIQYQFSNVRLFSEIFGNWKEFQLHLFGGPQSFQQYLFDLWNQIRNDLAHSDILVNDIDKQVSIKDFNITVNQTSNGSKLFFLTLPDHDYPDAASKYVALVLTPTRPRYFTLEYSQNVLTKEKQMIIGELAIDENGYKEHTNYGPCDNTRLGYFGGFVMGLLESQGE